MTSYDFTYDESGLTEPGYFEVVTDPEEQYYMPSATDAGNFEILESGEIEFDDISNIDDSIGENHIIVTDELSHIPATEYDLGSEGSQVIITESIPAGESDYDISDGTDRESLNELVALASIRDSIKSGSEDQQEQSEEIITYLRSIDTKVQYTNILLATIIGILFIYLLLSKIHV